EPPPLHSFPTRRSSDLSLGQQSIRPIRYPLSPSSDSGIIPPAMSNRPWLAFILLLTLSAILRADRILLKDGTVLEGTVITQPNRSEEHTSELQSLRHLV